MKFTSSKAQGTIEYLIILAIVVVIGLVVVSLLTNQTNTQTINTTTDKIETQTRGGITVTESYSDFEEDNLLSLRNNSRQTQTLKKITTGNTENTYNTRIQPNQETLINLNQLDCVCEEGQTSKTCKYTLTYESENGIEYNVTQETTIDCLNEVNAATTPENPISFGCFDESKSPVEICSIYDLNKIREFSDRNYILMNNIDATETKNWNNGNGWDPIASFSGVLNGNYKKIEGLQIFRVGQWENGSLIYNLTTAGKVQNLKLQDINFFGWASSGITINNNGTIENVSVTGNIVATNIGGIAQNNAENGLIENSYTDINMFSCSLGFNGEGGISYQISDYSTIINTYSISNNMLTNNNCDLFVCEGLGCGGGMTFIGGIAAAPFGGDINSSYFSSNLFDAPASPIEQTKTETQLKQQATYVDWDFTNIWQIDEGNSYPKFIWED
jgi:hypothetical protein